VSEVIRETERDMAAFEEKTAVATAQSKPDFRPQSKLFAGAQQPMRATPATAPIAARPQPEALDEDGETPRMPRVEDFPPMVKAEVESHGTRTSQASDEDDRGPLGLLKRLTHGLTREEKAAVPTQKLRPAEGGVEQRPAEPRRQLSQDAQLYAPRKGQLDDHGRPSTQQNPSAEEDQLEIPAFLRRQAN
jgi:cell division protein FtsZ